MHSNIKNPKYKTNCGKNNADDGDYDEEPGDLRSSNRKTKNLPQLCIDIEMNQSVQNLLASSDKCTSALLDVTIIKPMGADNQPVIETNIMKATQVRKLLTTLDREKRDKILIKELFEDKAPSEDTIIRIHKHNPRRKMQAASDLCYENTRERKFLKSQFHRPIKPKNMCSSAPVEARKQMFNHCYSPGVLQVSPMIGENCSKIPSDESFTDNVERVEDFKCGDHKKTQHVYAAPRTFKDLNSIITCQSMSKDDRTPCLCDHCGIASLLSETQKRPIITAPVEHVSDLRRRMNRKEYKEQSKHEYRKRKSDAPYSCEDKTSFQAGLAHLYERVKILEERMDIQEERAVPKDYFKRIITKIISHFSPKDPYRNDFQIRDSDSSSYVVQPRYKNNYSVNTLLVDKKASQKGMNDKSDKHEHLKKLLSNLTENMPEGTKTELAENFWQWGGEILKPGVDLKNKILSLLDMTKDIQKQEEPDNRPKTQESSRETKKLNNSSSNRSLPDNKEFNSAAFKSFVEAMSAKIYKSQKKAHQEEQKCKTRIEVDKSSGQTMSDTSLYKKPHRGERDQKSQKKSMIPKITKKEMKAKEEKNNSHETTKKLNVSYVNPKMSTWQEEESQISFRLEFSDADTNTRSKDSKNRDLEKLEFLRTLSRTKDSDKERLWESIWAQAKANGQTKQDKVTIQLPRKNGSEFNDMIEIEFTIGEIEYMLTKHKYADKNKMKS
ncbi:uncharacterized protein LOC123674447 [Harmonia axyridis]|uniref:uncharacterized protein LOC123674447 n=1 Tax=Harmonia axyridis TaxID=115357 RepID=UPI001E274DE6|nr:uncharacterized protein LOC123674447 [Harmonia axyridis]